MRASGSWCATAPLFSLQDTTHADAHQGLGVALTVLRQSLALGTTALRRRMLVSLEIANRDRAYEWVLAWMAHQSAQAAVGAGVRGLLARGARSHQLSVETRVQQHANGSASVGFALVAGPGVHWFKYRGAWMQVRRAPACLGRAR